jgi:hypothetical protein
VAAGVVLLVDGVNLAEDAERTGEVLSQLVLELFLLLFLVPDEALAVLLLFF